MDYHIRLAAFKWLKEQTNIYGEILPRSILSKGFPLNGEYITLVGPRGIWKPKQTDLPISITTTPESKYDDGLMYNGLLSYRYQGTNPMDHDNIGLRDLMKDKIPLIYFHGVSPGNYHPAWPVFIQEDDIKNLTFIVAVEAQEVFTEKTNFLFAGEVDAFGRRAYLTTTYRKRLHQSTFRLKVLQAYRNQCTLCNLKHKELLDAAHILEDKHEFGDPIVTNGLSLCKIHHAAFDSNIIGISPDYVVRVREDILEEIDGPMLKHGLQSLNNLKIHLPRHRHKWPDSERLELRFSRFLSASA